jgi:hypothetical protein
MRPMPDPDHSESPAVINEPLREYARAHGIEAAVVLVRRRLREEQLAKSSGAAAIDDEENIAAMAQHLLANPGLTLTEAARLVADRHFQLDGRTRQPPELGRWSEDSFVRRLVRKANFFCFDDARRGFDRGRWLK